MSSPFPRPAPFRNFPSSSSRALKRLRKSANTVGDDSDSDNVDKNVPGKGEISSSRREQEEDLGSSRSSSGRRSGEVGYKNAGYGPANSKSGSRRHAASPSSGAPGKHSHRHNNGGRRRDRDSGGSSSSSRSRSPSRSKSRSRSERQSTPVSATLFDRLKADWGKESWQDFELLQSNMPGPGTKGYNGPGASQGALGGKSECSLPRVRIESQPRRVYPNDSSGREQRSPDSVRTQTAVDRKSVVIHAKRTRAVTFHGATVGRWRTRSPVVAQSHIIFRVFESQN